MFFLQFLEIFVEEIGLMEKFGCAIILNLLICNILVVSLHLSCKLFIVCVLEQCPKGTIQDASFVHLQTKRLYFLTLVKLLELWIETSDSSVSKVLFELSFLSFEWAVLAKLRSVPAILILLFRWFLFYLLAMKTSLFVLIFLAWLQRLRFDPVEHVLCDGLE